MVFGTKHLRILQADTRKLHNKYEGSNFYLGRPLYSQNKVHISQ